jgi:hypothetical protein
MSQHELCDDIASEISDFEYLVSVVEQSISGKIKLNGFTPKTYKINSLKSFVEDVISASQSFRKELDKMGDKYIGIKSECESFIGVMQRKLYLVNFTMKEDLKRRIKASINESMPKNIANHDEVDKFMGRRPKSIKARINQIYRIVKRYGIDSKTYHDNHWQAKDDYYKAITSLGCEFEMRPCADSSRIDDWDNITSDGGYTDYDPDDHMPRSKQYAIKIMYDDGMNIGGYIKFMAAGTMDDPFSSYDTCIILWPKNNRVLEGKLMEFTNPNGDLDDHISPYSNSNFDYNGDKNKEIEHSWKRFDNKPISSSSDDFMHGVRRRDVPYEVDKAINKRDRENYFTDYENNKGRKFMNNWVNGKQELPMENRKINVEYRLTESELKQLVSEAVNKLIEDMSVADREKRMQNQMSWHDFEHQPEDIDKTSDLINKAVKGHAHAHDLHKEDPKTWKYVTDVKESEIKIKPENKGKFNATKKATGKSAEELKHSKNPLTRKRATFAINAKKWSKK